jgi:hypothetical protein
MNTIDLIKTISRRPGVYVDVMSTDSIYSFIQGFYFSRSVNGGLDTQDRWFAERFYPWLKGEHRLEDVATWGGQIAQLAVARQAAPWDTFICEFDRFLLEAGRPKDPG